MGTDDQRPEPRGPGDEFVQEFARAQRRLFLHILSMVPNPVDAEEILQETNVVIWRKVENYTPGTNFLAWARQIASYEVMKYRDRCRREKLVFSDEVIQRLSAEVPQDSELQDRRRRALLDCIQKLRPRDRELLQRRYAAGSSGKSVAAWLGRPANSVYQSLGRIRRSLLECVSRRLAEESG